MMVITNKELERNLGRFGIFFMAFTVLIMSNVVFAATHYVSPTGSATWSQSENISQPCSLQTAMSNSIAGDLVYFRGGEYDPGDAADYTHPAMYPDHSGTEGNPITLKAYPDETVILIGNDKGPTFGANNKNYIVWDGFNAKVVKFLPEGVNRAVTFVDSDHCTIKNCDIEGLTITWHANNMCIGVYESEYVTIENCKLHGAFRSDIMEINSTAVMTYSAYYLEIKNCTIYDCVTGIFEKDAGRNNVYHHNYIYNCFIGIAFGNNQAGGYGENAQIYQNVIRDVDNGIYNIGSNALTNNPEIFNNTIYKAGSKGTRAVDFFTTCRSLTIFNNIIFNYTYGARYYSDTVSYSDRNCWYEVNCWNMDGYTGIDYSPISTWTSVTSFDANSITSSDPLFANAGGSSPADYKLIEGSPCKGTGKDGKDMGAYPNGDDATIIGYVSGGFTIKPSAPENLKVTQ